MFNNLKRKYVLNTYGSETFDEDKIYYNDKSNVIEFVKAKNQRHFCIAKQNSEIGEEINSFVFHAIRTQIKIGAQSDTEEGYSGGEFSFDEKIRLSCSKSIKNFIDGIDVEGTDDLVELVKYENEVYLQLNKKVIDSIGNDFERLKLKERKFDIGPPVSLNHNQESNIPYEILKSKDNSEYCIFIYASGYEIEKSTKEHINFGENSIIFEFKEVVEGKENYEIVTKK